MVSVLIRPQKLRGTRVRADLAPCCEEQLPLDIVNPVAIGDDKEAESPLLGTPCLRLVIGPVSVYNKVLRIRDMAALGRRLQFDVIQQFCEVFISVEIPGTMRSRKTT